MVSLALLVIWVSSSVGSHDVSRRSLSDNRVEFRALERGARSRTSRSGILQTQEFQVAGACTYDLEPRAFRRPVAGLCWSVPGSIEQRWQGAAEARASVNGASLERVCEGGTVPHPTTDQSEGGRFRAHDAISASCMPRNVEQQPP